MNKTLINSILCSIMLLGQFAQGDVVVPENGMQAIPDQIAAHLSPHQIRLNTPVEKMEGKTIFLRNGETIVANKIVLATDASHAAQLLGETSDTIFNATDCLYLQVIPLSVFRASLI